MQVTEPDVVVARHGDGSHPRQIGNEFGRVLPGKRDGDRPVALALGRNQVEDVAGRLARDGGMGVPVESLRRNPVVTARHQRAFIHALLDHRPRAVSREEEAVVIDLKPVLHGGRVDFRREPAGANQRRRILAGRPARGLDLLGRLARGLPLAACDKDPGLT